MQASSSSNIPQPSPLQPAGTALLRPFYPALDGLRAVAFIMVFCFHYCRVVSDAAVWKWGWVGVDLFFVISGFLITGILYDSQHNDNYFRNFYIRRTLRIFPLFYGFWIVLLLLTPFFHFQWNRYLLLMALYVGNFAIPGAILGLHADPSLISFGAVMPRVAHYLPGALEINHFWSLCVEEQFYLAWPLVIWLIRSRRALMWLCLAVVALVPFARMLYLHARPDMLAAGGVYFVTWARPDGLLLGAALAFFLRGTAVPLGRLRAYAIAVSVVAPLLLVALICLEKNPAAITNFDYVVSTFGFSLLALTAAGLLVLSLEQATLFSRVLQLRPLQIIGRVAYGMYFYHELYYGFIISHKKNLADHHVVFLLPFITFALTFLLSSLSFRFFESKFLRLKKVLADRPGAVEDPPVELTATSLLPEA